MWKSGHCRHPGVSFLSSRDKSQVVRRGDNHLYQVSHLATLLLFFFFETSSSDWLELYGRTGWPQIPGQSSCLSLLAECNTLSGLAEYLTPSITFSNFSPDELVPMLRGNCLEASPEGNIDNERTW